MTSGYVVAGYGVTVATLALYALRVVLRGRALSRSVGDDAEVAPERAPL